MFRLFFIVDNDSGDGGDFYLILSLEWTRLRRNRRTKIRVHTIHRLILTFQSNYWRDLSKMFENKWQYLKRGTNKWQNKLKVIKLNERKVLESLVPFFIIAFAFFKLFLFTGVKISLTILFKDILLSLSLSLFLSLSLSLSIYLSISFSFSHTQWHSHTHLLTITHNLYWPVVLLVAKKVAVILSFKCWMFDKFTM